jgi:hypothetical protein
MGCFAKGCLTLIVLAILLIVVGIGGTYWSVRHVNRHAAWSIHIVLFGPSGPCLPAAATKITDIQRIIAQRNRIVHGYDAVDDLLVWDAVENHLPTLLTEVERLP